MSASFPLEILGWLLFSLLITVVNVYAACILLREGGTAPMLMLAGSILALVGGVGTNAIMLLEFGAGMNCPDLVFRILSPLGGLGWFLLSMGWLLFALRRRSLAARIAELESIVVAGREPDGSR